MVDLVADNKPLYAISCLICLIKINLWEKNRNPLVHLIISTLFMACLNNAKNNKKARSVLCLFIDYDLMNCCKLLINTLEI